MLTIPYTTVYCPPMIRAVYHRELVLSSLFESIFFAARCPLGQGDLAAGANGAFADKKADAFCIGFFGRIRYSKESGVVVSHTLYGQTGTSYTDSST